MNIARIVAAKDPQARERLESRERVTRMAAEVEAAKKWGKDGPWFSE